MFRNRIREIAASAAVAACLVVGASGAHAASLTFEGLITKDQGTTTYDPDVDRVTLTCSIGCQGILTLAPSTAFPFPTTDPSSLAGFATAATGTTGTGISDLFDASNNSSQTVAEFVNAVVEKDTGTLGTFTKDNVDDERQGVNRVAAPLVPATRWQAAVLRTPGAKVAVGSRPAPSLSETRYHKWL